MFVVREFFRAIRITIILWLITAIIYPLFILVIGQNFFPKQANGSMQKNIEGEIIGSALIGQEFRSERYFHSRPSTIRYSQGKAAKPTGISGASNLAPSNQQLVSQTLEEANLLQEEEDIQPFAELIYSSGSGLDPHISVKAAREQLERVAEARGFTREERVQIIRLIKRHTDGRFLGLFGEPGVNILKLNYALDLQEAARN
ncbi:MAG: K(+)-transporting ATPase subunit C [Nostocaceae cyanobacterium]|nr:K(+)-transporting ATPase subunit C [Nostocaceae cyanobacterium]